MARHVVIVAAGSRGHVDPYVGLGAHLREAGYRTTIAAEQVFEELITSAGLGFRRLPGEMWTWAPRQHSGSTDPLSRGRLEMARRVRSYTRDVNLAIPSVAHDADVILTGELGQGSYHFAKAAGVPSIAVHVAPTYPLRPRLAEGRDVSHLLRTAEQLYFSGVDELRARHGLAPTTFSETCEQQHAEGWPMYFGFSPSVVPRPTHWRPGLDVVGYWWPHVPSSWIPPNELVRFMEGGPPPVFVGLGSMLVEDPERVGATIVDGLRQAGARGVVQAGRAGLRAHGADMLSIGDVSYEWLFPRTAAVVHAGGAGISGAGYRAGVPNIAIPHTSPDQPFWAERSRALGVSPTVSLSSSGLTSQRLAEAVGQVLHDHAYRRNAQSLARRVDADDGAGRVLKMVMSLV